MAHVQSCSLLLYTGMYCTARHRLGHAYVWQSWVEIEHYSVAQFDRVTTFEALQRKTSVKDRAHMQSEDAEIPDKST